MSSVEEETPTASPDQGTTGETATSVQLAEPDETTKNSEATDTEHGKGRWTRAAEVVYPQ